MKPDQKKLKPIPRTEQDLPSNEYLGLVEDSEGGPDNPEGIPDGLRDISEMDAIAWVMKNCKFARNLNV